MNRLSSITVRVAQDGRMFFVIFHAPTTDDYQPDHACADVVEVFPDDSEKHLTHYELRWSTLGNLFPIAADLVASTIEYQKQRKKK